VWTRFEFEECVARYPHIREENRYAFHLRRWMERFGEDRTLVLFYDDLQAHEQTFADSVCDFIGVDRIDLRTITLPREVYNSIARAPKYRKLAQNARHLRRWLREHDAHRLVRTLQDWGVWRWCFGRGEPFGPIAPDLDARLRELFRPEVEALEELVGRDLTSWKFGRSGDRHVSNAVATERAARLRA
ncbi:MAG: hypothetical protein ACREQF_12430, partial [Candidatus Binataceae bacterium]